MIVILHIPFYDYSVKDPQSLKYVFSSFLDNGILRLAVPSFFILNGYFINVSSLAKIKKYISRILVVFIVWSLFYLPFYYWEGPSIILLCFTYGFNHLWYIPALIGGAILLFLFNRFFPGKDKLLLIVSSFLFIIGTVLQTFSFPVSSIFYRNFLMYGFPFISIGYLVRKGFYTHNNKYINIGLIVGAVFLFTEAAIRNLIIMKGGDFMISLLVICPFLLLFILSRSKVKVTDTYISDMSGAVYYVHCAIIYAILPLTAAPRISLIPTIVILSFFSAYIIASINKKIKIFL